MKFGKDNWQHYFNDLDNMQNQMNSQNEILKSEISDLNRKRKFS